MLEAIMIVTMMSGQVVQTKVPNFTECLANVPVVEVQKSVKFAACIPRGSKPDASMIFDKFLRLNLPLYLEKLKELDKLNDSKPKQQ